MNSSKFEFADIVKLLGHSENDQEVRNFFEHAMFTIERDEYYGSLEFEAEGVDVVFKEAPWVIPREKIVDPKELYLVAFHLHRDGHEGYVGYRGRLPNHVAFGEGEVEITQKMGQPTVTGGGRMVPVLNRRGPRWIRYSVGDMDLHFQFDADDRLELVTPLTPALILK